MEQMWLKLLRQTGDVLGAWQTYYVIAYVTLLPSPAGGAWQSSQLLSRHCQKPTLNANCQEQQRVAERIEVKISLISILK